MNAEVVHNIMPPANQPQAGNAEVLVQMLGDDFVDTKVRS